MDTHQQINQQREQQHQQQQQPATRVVSHWAKSTPEEGIQVIFNRADTERATAGVRILTSPTSLERPCQWDICLRLSSSSPYLADSSSSPSKTTASSTAPSGTRSSTPTTAPPSRRLASQPQLNAPPSTPYHISTSPLLVLALQRANFRLSSAGHGAMAARNEGPGGFEDPMSPGRARCDSYRTIYIYSPRLHRDILVQPINREFWPQIVVFKCEDVLDEDHKYHFQIWLSGSSPRQTDAETDARTNQQRNLLFAMRQDTTTCNVQINIKDPPPLTVQQARLETAPGFGSGIKKRAVSGGDIIGGGGSDGGGNSEYSEGDNYNSLGNDSSSNNYYTPPTSKFNSAASSSCSNSTYEEHDTKHAHLSKLQDHLNNNNHTTETIGATFWAHKTILESVPLFSRMLSCGRFKEGQPGPDGIHRINLSSDMFEPKIMDILLDYVYTREPIHDDDATGNGSMGIGNTTEEYCHHDSNRNIYADNYESISDPPVMDRHHHASANVALNLQAAISEPSPLRSHHPQSYSYCQSNTYKGSNSLWPFTPASGTTPSTTIQQQLPPPTPPHIIPYASRHTRSIRTRLKPEDWFLLYRAAIHMEDPTLQAQALDKIQAQLNVQSALERALTWGPGYPEIKRVVLKYVFDERRAIFGDEEQNQLRPYLWPEIEDQVDVLVEITSKIARQ